MATVEMSFTPLPAHVRTARLVATAVARRSGVDESLLDEVRLAVGEACSRAVEAHQEHCPAEPVRVASAILATDLHAEHIMISPPECNRPDLEPAPPSVRGAPTRPGLSRHEESMLAARVAAGDREAQTPTTVNYARAAHGTFVNTGLRALAHFDLLFDADGGYLGLRAE